MKIYYNVMEVRGSKNVFLSVPRVIESCCPESMVWFTHSGTDLDIKNSRLVRKRGENSFETFQYCQFCAKKHEMIRITDRFELTVESESINSVNE